MPKQKIIIIVIGVVLGLVAVMLMKVNMDSQRQAIVEEAKEKIASIKASIPKSQAQVLVASKDIAKGSMVAADSVEVKVVPEEYRQPQAVSSVDRIIGMVTVVPISKNEQITLTKLSQSSQGGNLAEGTPIGKRAIPIAVDSLASLGGMIKPGDYVDVIVLVMVPTQGADGKPTGQVAAMPLFQNILVLAVGQETAGVKVAGAGGRYAPEERKGTDSPMITLALNSQEANLVAFVQEQGKMRLTLRSPADSKIEPVQPATWDTLFKYIMPQAEQQPEVVKSDVKAEVKEVVPAEEYIEILRGTTKDKILISK